MPARRLLMRKIREVLRLKHEQGLSHQAVAQACAVGVGTVNRYLQRAAQRGLGWPLPDDLDDAALEARLFPRAAPVHDRIRPDCAYIHRELKRDSVTLQLLWEEYAQIHPDGYGRTQFCEIYRQWTRRLRPSMRQVHRAGEKTFIDYSGKRPSLVDRRTGELRRVELFVAVLGASSLTYAAATETQQLPDWSTRISAWWSTSAALPRCGSPTSSRAPSPAPAATSPASTAPTRTWPPTTAPSSFRRDRGNLGIRLLWRIVYSSHSGGYSPASATRPSSSSAR